MPHTIFPELTEKRLRRLQDKASTKREFQRVQCLYLRHHGASSTDIAAALAMSGVSVKRVWIDYRKRGEEAVFKERRGGRYRENMTAEEECHFLSPFLKEAEKGSVLVVNEIHHAYEKRLKRQVPKSTVYAMLHRHGWRKIVPRPHHPKGNKSAQEIFRVSFPPNPQNGRD